MKYLRSLSLAIIFCLTWSMNAQNFKGILSYEVEVIPHLSKEYNFSFKDPNGKKKDSKNFTLNDSTLIATIKAKVSGWIPFELFMAIVNSKRPI